MKKSFLNLAMAALFLAPVTFNSCKDDKPDNAPIEQGDTWEGNILKGNITKAMKLDASVTYTLSAPLIIENGGKLIIPAGTTIKAQQGFDKYILVAQGGQIFANGTADKPVTMTSAAANPKAEDWGGLIINGYAPLAGGETASAEINTDYKYGGNKVDDNSGVLTYVTIAYTGARNSAEVEHNGLTLNGVGNGTKIENIYIPYSADDGVEFFGGSVHVKNLFVLNSDDDCFDVTQGWTGTLENAYGMWSKSYSSTEADPRGIEVDGNFDGNFPNQTGQSNFTMKNITIDLRLDPIAKDHPDFAAKSMQDVIKIRRGATCNIINALVKGTGTAQDLIDITDSKGAGNPASVISLTNALVNPFTGKDINFNAEQLYDGVHAFGSDVSKLKIQAGNTGCPTDIFAWTKYQF